MENKLYDLEKRRAFVGSSVNIDPFMWMPENYDQKDGFYIVNSNNIEPETKGMSRNKFWIKNSEGKKQAIFAQNFERNENIFSLIYCELADLAKVSCMSSAPAKYVSPDGKTVEGLISCNVNSRGVESLMSADEFSNSATTIKELEKFCEFYAKEKGGFVDPEFSLDFAKQLMLNYLTVSGDKSSLANYNIASVKTKDGSMFCVAPSIDNGLAFGLGTKSMMWGPQNPILAEKYKSRFQNRIGEIKTGLFNPQMKNKAKEIFNSEFGEVVPLMPYKSVEGMEKGDKETAFLEQISVLILENEELKETYNRLMNIEFEDVKSGMQTRHKGLNVEENLYETCEVLFGHRRQVLNEKFAQMEQLKNENPIIYSTYLNEMKSDFCDECCM